MDPRSSNVAQAIGEDLTRVRLLALMSGYTVTQAIRSFAELEIADKLAERPITVEDLAERAQCVPDALERLLVVLRRLGLVAKKGDLYELTTTGSLLRRDLPGNLWSAASFFGGELYRAAGTLPDTVRTGQPGAEAAFGASIWRYLDEHPERGAVFDDMLATVGAADVEAILDAYDFSHAHTVVDVGGGNGALLHAILKKHRYLRGVLIETESVIDRMCRADVPVEILKRCDYMRGSFFDGVSVRGDVYILKHVLHDWDDERAVAILRACRAALSRSARLLIVESVVDAPGHEAKVDWMALGIAAAFGGKERTLDEYRSLCGRAGLVVERRIETATAVSVIEAASR